VFFAIAVDDTRRMIPAMSGWNARPLATGCARCAAVSIVRIRISSGDVIRWFFGIAEMTDEQNQLLAARSLEHGGEYPYDATDAWWHACDDTEPPSPKDMAHAAARGIIADLKDRRGIKNGFERVDEETRKQIVERMAEIVRQAIRAFGKQVSDQ